MSLQFVWPLAFISLPLPLLIRWLLPPAPHYANVALKAPFFRRIKNLDNKSFSPTTTSKIRTLTWVIWILLVFALARPQLPDVPVELPSGHDLLIAVDISKSMANSDLGSQGVQNDRLSVVKRVVGQFIERREGDRVGLILFGEGPYLQTPLTIDLITVKTMLEEAFIGLVAGKSTAIGDAIGLAIKRLRERTLENRVLILITDGNNNAGEIEPLQAAEWAANEGIHIYVIGLVSDKMQIDTPSGSRYVNTFFELDEKTLQEIASKTSGKYFSARNSVELEDICHKQLDALEPVKAMFSRKKELYLWLVGIALFLSFLLIPLKVYRI